jgi:hypothetical protein
MSIPATLYNTLEHGEIVIYLTAVTVSILCMQHCWAYFIFQKYVATSGRAAIRRIPHSTRLGIVEK